MVGPVQLRLGAEVVKGGHAMDVMVHPNYLGQSIFLKLARHCAETAKIAGFKVFYAFPNPLSYPGFVRRLDWNHIGDVIHWVRPIKPSGYEKVPSSLGPIVDSLVRVLPKGRARHFHIQIGKIKAEKLDSLIKLCSISADLCRVDRNQKWFNWRYSKDAQSDYEWVSAYEEDRLEALAIWGMRNKTP